MITSAQLIDTLNKMSIEFAFYNMNILSDYIKTIKAFYPDMVDSIYQTTIHEYLYENNYKYFIEVLVEQCCIQGIINVDSETDQEYIDDLLKINREVIAGYKTTEDDVIDDLRISLNEERSKEKQNG